METRRGRCLEEMTESLLEKLEILMTGLPARYVPKLYKRLARPSILILTRYC